MGLNNELKKPVQKYGGKLTKEIIESAVDYIFNQKVEDTERRVMLVKGCLNKGFIIHKTGDPYLVMCDNPKCNGCRAVEKEIRNFNIDESR